MGLSFILFFEEGWVPVAHESEPGSRKLPVIVEEKIEANTIVLNRNAGLRDEGNLEIYQACFICEWYYLFYRFNGFTSTDLRMIPTR